MKKISFYWVLAIFTAAFAMQVIAVPSEFEANRWHEDESYRPVAHGLVVGAAANTDRDYVFTDIPDRLKGASYVMTRMEAKASDSSQPLLQLELNKEATVLVGFDARCQQMPAWLGEWHQTGEMLKTTGGEFQLFEKSAPAGQVILHGNQAKGADAMYVVVVSGEGQALESVKIDKGYSLSFEDGPVGPIFNHAPKYDEFFTPEMEAAVESVLTQMTVDEKLKMVNGDIEGRGPKHRGSASVDRVGIETMVFYNGPRGYQMGAESTLYPAGIGLAATFRPDLTETVATAIAKELLADGIQVLEAPSMNIIRDPLNGRNFEYFTEDPYLNGKLTAAFVIGGQRAGAVTTAKHFIANNKETNRNQVNAMVTERALHEIYLPGFKAACEAGVLSLMTGANRVNGPHASDNPDLVSILKQDWGWPGFLYTDWNGAQTTVEAFNAGLDLSMPGQPNGAFGFAKLKAAFDAGQIDENTLDDKVRRLLRGVYFAGKLVGSPPQPKVKVDFSAHHKLAYEAALASMTLVKNEKATLPITDRDQTIAVVGPLAGKRFSDQSGGSSGVGGVPYDITAIDGLRKRFGEDRLKYVPFSMDDVYEPISSTHVYHLDSSGQRVSGFAAHYTGTDPVTLKPAVFDTTVDQIEFNWEMASPNREVLRPDDFRAKWSGVLVAPVSGNYTLRVDGSQMVYVSLDDEVVLNKHFIQREREITLELEANREYRFDMSLRKFAGDSVIRLSWIRPDQRNRVDEIIQQSVAAAKQADVVLVFIGQDHNTESEGMDRQSMRLPEYHDQLVSAVRAVNPRTVVVAYCGSPIAMDPWFTEVPAIVLPWLPGIENGNALASVLSGDEDFGGRMPITFPKSYADSPAHPSRQAGVDKYTTILHNEGVFVGYRWYDGQQIAPLIPFGYGLSYSQFEYSQLRVEADSFPVKVTITVTNTGDRSGIVVPQLYVHDLKSSLPRPPRELKGFSSLKLDAGESQEIEFELDRGAFSYYDPSQHEWILDPGVFEILIGNSSRSIELNDSFEL
jgi:beta-glucosidase